MEMTMPFCAGTLVHECLCTTRRSAPFRKRNFNPSRASSGERLPKVFRDLVDEAMHGRLREAMPGNRIHRPSQGAKGWFVKPQKIQLRFGAFSTAFIALPKSRQ